MTLVVVDASVVAKWFFPEEHSAAAGKLLGRRYRLLAPDLLWSEVGNIAWKRVRHGELDTQEAQQIVADLTRMPIEVSPTQPLVESALELALATERTVYDCMYLALAVHRSCKLMTADVRFANALAPSPLAKFVRHVATFR